MLLDDDDDDDDDGAKITGHNETAWRRGEGATPCRGVRTAACGGPRLGLRAVTHLDFTCGPRAVGKA